MGADPTLHGQSHKLARQPLMTPHRTTLALHGVSAGTDTQRNRNMGMKKPPPMSPYGASTGASCWLRSGRSGPSQPSGET